MVQNYSLTSNMWKIGYYRVLKTMRQCVQAVRTKSTRWSEENQKYVCNSLGSRYRELEDPNWRVFYGAAKETCA